MASLLISNSASEIIPQNRLRKSFIIQNEDASIEIFLKRERGTALTVSTTDHDHRLASGGNLAVNSLIDGKESVQDRWTIIAASGTPRVSWFETEDVER